MNKYILPREAALKILHEVDKNKAYTNIVLNKYLKGYNYTIKDRNLISELIYGIIKNKLNIDYIIGHFSTIKISKMSVWIINILRLGVYQIIFLDKIPDFAACNESVNLAKKYSNKKGSGFVNAVLRNAIRNKENIHFPDNTKNPYEYLSIMYSYPLWLVKKWVSEYGFDFTEKLCKAGNNKPHLCVRVNTLKITPDNLINILENEGIKVCKGKFTEEVLILENVHGIDNLESYKKGFFYVQDESSVLVSKILDAKSGELVIDACSAPGGKATHMAQLMQNKGKILAWDIHPHKIKLINASAKRLGINIISGSVNDSTMLYKELAGKADKVLVDAPCSGLGIIRRKPDIKWNKNIKDLDKIVDLQKRILNVSAKYVKLGGFLVYSTCTINNKENIDVVNDFVKCNNNFVFCDITQYIHGTLQKKESLKNGYVQLFPNVDNTDGFFICKLMRKQ